MKVTLDLNKLLDEGNITQEEYIKFNGFAVVTTASLAFNILLGFGVIAVSGAALALVPAASTAILIGLITLAIGLRLLRGSLVQWVLLANIFILVGALLSGGGIVTVANGSLAAILAVTALFSVVGIVARSALLVVLATLMLSASIEARTGYFHTNHFLIIQESTLTVVLFSLLGLGIYQLSKRLSAEFERLAIASAKTCVLLVNFGFWVGSLWNEESTTQALIISDSVFAMLWAIALIATASWSWQRNYRWMLNAAATFGGVHFYTQWFEHLGASPSTFLLAGILALGFALGLNGINKLMKQNA